MNYWARDTTQSDFGIAYTALCQQVNKFDREMAQCNMRVSNSFSEIEARINQCCCNLEQAKMMLNLGMQVRNDELEKKKNELLLQNMQAYSYGAYDFGKCDREPQKTIREELSQCKTHEEMLQVARKHGCAIDLTKQEDQEKPVTFIDLRANLDNTPLRDLGVRRVYEAEQGKTVIIEDKPKKKYTIYDLYDLTFPDDPIKKHFVTVCNNIERSYQERKEVLDQIEAPEVRIHHVEPIPTVTIDDHSVLDAIAVVMLVMLSVALIFAFCILAYFAFSLV